MRCHRAGLGGWTGRRHEWRGFRRLMDGGISCRYSRIAREPVVVFIIDCAFLGFQIVIVLPDSRILQAKKIILKGRSRSRLAGAADPAATQGGIAGPLRRLEIGVISIFYRQSATGFVFRGG